MKNPTPEVNISKYQDLIDCLTDIKLILNTVYYTVCLISEQRDKINFRESKYLVNLTFQVHTIRFKLS